MSRQVFWLSRFLCSPSHPAQKGQWLSSLSPGGLRDRILPSSLHGVREGGITAAGPRRIFTVFPLRFLEEPPGHNHLFLTGIYTKQLGGCCQGQDPTGQESEWEKGQNKNLHLSIAWQKAHGFFHSVWQSGESFSKKETRKNHPYRGKHVSFFGLFQPSRLQPTHSAVEAAHQWLADMGFRTLYIEPASPLLSFGASITDI